MKLLLSTWFGKSLSLKMLKYAINNDWSPYSKPCLCKTFSLTFSIIVFCFRKQIESILSCDITCIWCLMVFKLSKLIHLNIQKVLPENYFLGILQQHQQLIVECFRFELNQIIEWHLNTLACNYHKCNDVEHFVYQKYIAAKVL